MLSYILQQVSYKMGLNQTNPAQRAVMLRFVNEAVVELYQQSDMAGCLEEQYFKINSNQTISLPEYVGQIRAMREAYSHIALKLSQMRPRYNQFSWPDEWRDWRLKGLTALQAAIVNQSIMTITVPAVETPPVVVSITGSSNVSANVTETITMTSTSMVTTNSFNDIKSVTKNVVNQYNVVIFDIDGNLVTTIPNDKLEARYQEVDISTSPWYPANVNPLLGWVEVLYKKALPWFSNDTDEFPAKGYDNIIVNKVLQLWCEEKGDIQGAMAYSAKATQSLAQIHEDMNRGTDDVVSLVQNPHDSVVHRVGFGRDYRYAYRIVGR